MHFGRIFLTIRVSVQSSDSRVDNKTALGLSSVLIVLCPQGTHLNLCLSPSLLGSNLGSSLPKKVALSQVACHGGEKITSGVGVLGVV